jgi:hypothetical protein
MINDFATLSTQVQNFTGRSDLASSMQTFVQLVEMRLRRDLRIEDMLLSLSGTVSGSSLTLPTDVLSIKSVMVTIGGNTYELIQQRTGAVDALAQNAGEPRYFSIKAGVMYFAPGSADGMSYTILYYQNFTALTPSTTNDIIVNNPDLYFFGCMQAANAKLKDYAAMAQWSAAFDNTITAANTESWNKRFAGPLAGRADVVV